MPVLNERNELAWVECPRYRMILKQAMQSPSLFQSIEGFAERVTEPERG